MLKKDAIRRLVLSQSVAASVFAPAGAPEQIDASTSPGRVHRPLSLLVVKASSP